MVASRHIGRLGNNLFQIAAAIGYARKYGYQWAVDPNSGMGEPYSSIHKVFPNLPKSDRLGGARYHEHPHGICNQHNQRWDDCHFNYHDIPDLGPDVLLTGFFQSWKYFEHCKDEVKEVFKLDNYPEYEGYVSIHVRRGDYVQHSGSFPPITLEYIQKATLIMGSKISVPYRTLFFSDDIQWCKDYFSATDAEYCNETDERKSLSIMASCSHHIIANSSFSWWGAYLGHNPNRIVVSPSHKRGNWFGHSSGIQKDCVDLLPPEWHQIEFRNL